LKWDLAVWRRDADARHADVLVAALIAEPGARDMQIEIREVELKGAEMPAELGIALQI